MYYRWSFSRKQKLHFLLLNLFFALMSCGVKINNRAKIKGWKHIKCRWKRLAGYAVNLCYVRAKMLHIVIFVMYSVCKKKKLYQYPIAGVKHRLSKCDAVQRCSTLMVIKNSS